MEVTGSDRTLATVGPARPIRCSSEDAGVGQTTGRWVALRPDAEGLRPVVLSVSTVRSHSTTGRWLGPVKHDRTHPVGKNLFWNLTVNDRTQGVQRSVSLVWSVRSIHVTIEIGTRGCLRATGRWGLSVRSTDRSV